MHYNIKIVPNSTMNVILRNVVPLKRPIKSNFPPNSNCLQQQQQQYDTLTPLQGKFSPTTRLHTHLHRQYKCIFRRPIVNRRSTINDLEFGVCVTHCYQIMATIRNQHLNNYKTFFLLLFCYYSLYRIYFKINH